MSRRSSSSEPPEDLASRRRWMDEHEARGLLRALKKAKSFARARRVEVACLYRFHFLIFEVSRPEIAGKQRQYDLTTETGYVPPTWASVGEHLAQFQAELRERMESLGRITPNTPENLVEIVELAVWAHHRIAWIHPFENGNGRSARVFQNLILPRYGLPIIPCTVEAADRESYIKALRQADSNQDYDPLIVLLLTELVRRWQEDLKASSRFQSLHLHRKSKPGAVPPKKRRQNR